MKSQQMMELLPKEIRANQAKMDADRKADWKAWRKEMAAMRNKMMDTSRKETAAVIKPETEVKTMACQEMEEHQEENPTSPDRKPEAAQKTAQ
jgi:hypothetical protein